MSGQVGVKLEARYYPFLDICLSMEPWGLGRGAAALKAHRIFRFTSKYFKSVFRHVAWRIIIIKTLNSNENTLIINRNLCSHLKALLLRLG